MNKFLTIASIMLTTSLGSILCFAAPSEIMNDLFLSDKASARNTDILDSLKITDVLDVTDTGLKVDEHGKPTSPEVLQSYLHKYTYKNIPTYDEANYNITKDFPSAHSFIHDALEHNRKVIVHCYLGVSRSSTIVISYLMKYKNYSFKDAYQLVHQKRPIINPNPGFIKQLEEYESALKSNQNISEQTEPLEMR